MQILVLHRQFGVRQNLATTYDHLSIVVVDFSFALLGKKLFLLCSYTVYVELLFCCIGHMYKRFLIFILLAMASIFSLIFVVVVILCHYIMLADKVYKFYNNRAIWIGSLE